MSKRLGGIKGYKYTTYSWHSNGFPDGNNSGSNQEQCSTPSHMIVIIYYYIGYKYKATTYIVFNRVPQW